MIRALQRSYGPACLRLHVCVQPGSPGKLSSLHSPQRRVGDAAGNAGGLQPGQPRQGSERIRIGPYRYWIPVAARCPLNCCACPRPKQARYGSHRRLADQGRTSRLVGFDQDPGHATVRAVEQQLYAIGDDKACFAGGSGRQTLQDHLPRILVVGQGKRAIVSHRDSFPHLTAIEPVR